MAELSKARLFQQVGYRPHDGQWLVHRSRAKRRVLACGVRFGKTTCAVYEALAALLAPGPGSSGWVVSPTYETSGILTQELFTVLKERFPHRIIELDALGRSAVVENLAGRPSSVEARSALRPEGLLGASLDWLIVDEAAKVKAAVWRECLVQRLTDRDGWALLTSTPAGEGDWFHGEFVRAREGDVAYEAWSMPSWANPTIDRAIVEAEAARLSEAEYYSQFAGEFVPATGRICPTCRWGEANDGRVLSIKEWGRCTACPDCERPIDEFGRPVGLMNAEGEICVSTMGHVLDEPAPGDHPDPTIRTMLDVD